VIAQGGVSSGITSALSGVDGIATGVVIGGRGSSGEGTVGGVQSWVMKSCPKRDPPSPRVSSPVSAALMDSADHTWF
jgi:hypothetical protein